MFWNNLEQVRGRLQLAKECPALPPRSIAILLQRLRQTDSAARMTFVSFSCSSVRDPALLSHVLLTDEAGFTCDGIVSCQSQRV
jgi:hypothetical protein